MFSFNLNQLMDKKSALCQYLGWDFLKSRSIAIFSPNFPNG